MRLQYLKWRWIMILAGCAILVAAVIIFISKPSNSYLDQSHLLNIETGMVLHEIKTNVENIAKSNQDLDLKENLKLNMTKNKFFTSYEISSEGIIAVHGTVPFSALDKTKTVPEQTRVSLEILVSAHLTPTGKINWYCSGKPTLYIEKMCQRFL